LRVRFTKLGKVRFTSHRDLARIWERALRKAGVRVAYTGGFAPRPRLHFGLALPTGYESYAEYLDIDLDPDSGIDTDTDTDTDIDLDIRRGGDVTLDPHPDVDGEPSEGRPGLVSRLSAALPDGIDVVAVAPVDVSADSLQQAVTSCTWTIVVDGASAADVAARADAVLSAEALPVTRVRKGREVRDDLRPHLLSLRLAHCDGDAPVLEAELGTQPRSVRPRELVAALHEGWSERRVCRLQQWMSHDGDRCEPLSAPAQPSWAPAEACAP
jgi:uncharacterized protein (DUF2344 family)